MKRVISGILAVLVCLACLPAFAETEDAEILKRDWARIRWGIAMTAGMAGSALDALEEAADGEQRALLERFAGVDFLSPDKAIVLELSKAEMQQAGAALGSHSNWADSSIALSEALNAQAGEAYAQASALARAEGSTTQEYSKYFVLIILPYGGDIAAISLTAYGSVNSRAAFIRSTPEACRDLGPDDVDRVLESFGLQRPRVSVYEKAELEALPGQGAWSGGSAPANRLADAVLASGRRQEVLLPVLLESGSPLIGVELKLAVLNTLLARMESADLEMVRTAAGVWLPLLSEGAGDLSGAFLDVQDEAYSGRIPPPDLAYGEELAETELKPDGTFLVAFETRVPDRDPIAWLDMRLEAVLPPGRIPETAEEADYIILCRTEYQGGTSMGGASLHYPYTRITVHDARTGVLLKELGAVHRTLSGAVMLPKGDTWWNPLRTELWEKIRVLFAEN